MKLFTLLLCLFPLTGTAETFVVPSKVTDVALYPDSAKITRKSTFSIPAGTHQLVVNNLPALDSIIRLQALATGATIGPIIFRESLVLNDSQSDSVEIQAAKDHIKSIEQQIRTVENDARRARLAAKAAETRIGFLDQLGRNDNIALLDLETVSALSQLIGTEALEARQVELTSEIAAQKIEHALIDLNKKLENAQKSLDILPPYDVDRAVVRIEVSADTATDGVLSLIYTASGSTSWTPVYDIYLNRKYSDYVDIKRNAFVSQETGENWVDVNLTLSTLEPEGRITPSALFPRRYRLEDPRPEPEPMPQNSGNLAEPMVEAPVIIEETGSAFYSVNSSGLGIIYNVARPVSIASSTEFARLPLGELRIPAKLSAMAVPSRDDTGFLIAEVTNDSGEDILYSPYASFYVDGALVGTDEINRITSNDTLEIGFGPINGLRLKSIRLMGGEGETGIISRFNERRSHQLYKVENLTDETWEVRMLSKVPYSNHDDLKIEWSTSRPPDEVDVDDKIGVLAWDLTLAPGATQSVDVETSVTWPSDKDLR